MIDLKQLKEFVVEPTNRFIGLWSPSADRIVIATGVQESGDFFWMDQTTSGPGPGRGFFQMEKLTHDDMWDRVIPKNGNLLNAMNAMCTAWPSRLDQLHTNLAYAAAMCRIKYWSIPEPLPDVDDMMGMANYWKKYYNTSAGKGTTEEFCTKWKKYIK